MNRILKSFAFTIAALSISVSASAVTISASAINQTTSSVAGVSTVTFDNGTCLGYASCTGSYKIVSGFSSGQYAAPYFNPSDTTKYLTVGNYFGTGNEATLKLGSTADYFGLFWGSIDKYNTISFLLGNVGVASYSGADVAIATAPALLANGGQQAWSSNRYINFNFGSAKFDTVILKSTSMAFESDNHAFRKTSVPEPTTLLLMSLGLFGLVATRRLKRD